MKKQHLNNRKQRTRMLIQLGGLVQKSGLLELLDITPGEDLQDYGNLPKAAQVLGFLIEGLERPDAHLHDWEQIGRRKLRYNTSK